MLARLIGLTALIALLAPEMARAEPVTLKLSFFTSDRGTIYECLIKPFVEAINNDGSDLVRIEVVFDRIQLSDATQVHDGRTDIAALPAAGLPKGFLDRALFQLPGLFRDQTEASRIFTGLIESGALNGLGEYVVLDAFISAGENIHSRKPITTLDDLRGQPIRVNNDIEAATLKKFGALPLILPVNETMEGLVQGKVTGATIPTVLLFEFGYGRLIVNHYLLELGGVISLMVMNRAKFASLSPAAQEIVRKHSGSWLSEYNSTCLIAKRREVLSVLENDPRRKVIYPSPADQAAADRAFAEVTEEWAAQSPRNRALLKLVKDEIAKLRAGK